MFIIDLGCASGIPMNVTIHTKNESGNEANRTLFIVIHVASKYTEFLINGLCVRAFARKSVKISWLIQFETEKVFFTQVFNLIVQKRLRSPNSKCACATAKRFGMLKETYRKGGLYLKGYSASTSFFKQILKLIITWEMETCLETTQYVFSFIFILWFFYNWV